MWRRLLFLWEGIRDGVVVECVDDPNLYLQGTIWHATASAPAPYEVGTKFMMNGTNPCIVTSVDDNGFTFIEMNVKNDYEVKGLLLSW